MDDFEAVWRSIVALQGETFQLKKGQPFRYAIHGNSLLPSTTSRELRRSQFARALERLPVQGPRQLGDLQGPSYLFAILTDPRVAGGGRSAPQAPAAHGSGEGHRARPRATAAAAPLAASGARRHSWVPAPDVLRRIDPRRALLVLPASSEKILGGRSATGQLPGWGSPALQQARAGVLAAVPSDQSALLPAWQRYMGGFYQHAGAALAEAVAEGNVLIISGGYGIVPATEPIGWYHAALHLAGWSAGLLEGTLIGEARRAGADAVVAFAPARSAYAELVRRAPWGAAGLSAFLVTVRREQTRAATRVPRRLGLAFRAFWHEDDDGYPGGTGVERLSSLRPAARQVS